MPSLSDALTSRMDFLVQRQAVVAGNIANANTPGYVAKDFVADTSGAPSSNFAMALTNAQHMSSGNGAISGGTFTEDKRFMQHNGNSVRLDNEMLKMNQTQLDYRFMTQLYKQQVALQKTALGR